MTSNLDEQTMVLSGMIKRLNEAKEVIILCGAGISTAAGIPDFRSPLTGLYANLQKYKLPHPQAIFEIDYFKANPQAFYTLAKEIQPGNFAPTLTHYFFTLLEKKGILNTVFSQNIDCLETAAGLTRSRLIDAHGSFASAECLSCRTKYTADEIKDQIALGEIVLCQRHSCINDPAALIKPCIVFFGEPLPSAFFDALPRLDVCDLLIVLGTSLSVHPFASLPSLVPYSCPRLLINFEKVGERDDEDEDAEGFEFDVEDDDGARRDVYCSLSSDEGVRILARGCGWEEELDEMMRKGTQDFVKTRTPIEQTATKNEVDVECTTDEEPGGIIRKQNVHNLDHSKEEQTEEPIIEELATGLGSISL